MMRMMITHHIHHTHIQETPTQGLHMYCNYNSDTAHNILKIVFDHQLLRSHKPINLPILLIL
jgi:hypothetical protein